MENENLEVVQAEEPSMSTKDMLIQALENAGSEEQPAEPTSEPAVEQANETAIEPTIQQEQPVSQPIKTEQPLYTRDDLINALGSVTPQPLEQPAEEPLPDFNSEEFMDEFYDNPSGAVEKAVNKIAEKKVREVVSGIEKKLQPLLSQSESAQLREEVKATIGDFLEHTEDARDYFNDMTSYIKSNNLDPRSSQTYQDAYRISKLNRLSSENQMLKANQGKGLGDYLSDENSLNEIAQNEIVRQKVIDEYLKGLNNGDKPRTIGSNGTNQPSAQQVNRPATMKDAKAMLLAQLRN